MSENNLFSAFFQSDDNDDDLIEKARIANNLAKMASGKNRDLLYLQKTVLLCRALERTPSNFAFSYWDERGIIGLRHTPTSAGFHIPATQLTAGARALLVQSLSRFLS